MSEIDIKENLQAMIDRLALQYYDRMDVFNREGIRRCPFCGSLEVEAVDTGFWSAVMCNNCHACTNSIPHDAKYSSREKAIELWNKRY